jgi:hypothetical protein
MIAQAMRRRKVMGHAVNVETLDHAKAKSTPFKTAHDILLKPVESKVRR